MSHKVQPTRKGGGLHECEHTRSYVYWFARTAITKCCKRGGLTEAYGLGSGV